MSDKEVSTYLLTPEAEKDLEDIWLYSYETWSETQANRYIEILEDTFVRLSYMPEQARELLDFDPPVRIFPSAKHIIIYRIAGRAIVIIRVLGARQDWITILHSLD
ncbi:type II toxin-antitoxin system RelE/ParE family toxin [Rhodobacterales bacterium FZCC0083]|nr:type II toxin-antitoxin system RelE/ParE family toxin [Rhodobacterales bacterium FZCC0083]